MFRFLTFFFCVLAQMSFADIVVPTRTLRPGDLITADVVRLVEGKAQGHFDALEDVTGQEARSALYANRPIAFDQIGPPALVKRNQIVQIVYSGGGLRISTEGRALERGGVGDRVRIMNLASRATLFGIVQTDGHVAVYK